jgi:hypothetical protein
MDNVQNCNGYILIHVVDRSNHCPSNGYRKQERLKERKKERMNETAARALLQVATLTHFCVKVKVMLSL